MIQNMKANLSTVWELYKQVIDKQVSDSVHWSSVYFSMVRHIMTFNYDDLEDT